ncbi:RNA-guided endonuclease InsQ/TnpB family protein (plasmid) [Bounagaea algeriensis]
MGTNEPDTPRRLRAYRFALNPTGQQLEALQQHAGAARWAYNHALAVKNEAHRRRSLQIDELVTLGWTEARARKMATVKVPSKQQIQKDWNCFKGDDRYGRPGICTWWRAVSTYAFQSAFKDADQAFQNFFNSLSGKRAGGPVGMPKFKKKGRSKDSFRLHHAVKSPTIRLDGYRRLQMPRFRPGDLGSVRLHDSAKRLSRALDRGGVVQSVTVSRGGKRWYAAVLVDEPDITPGRETQRGPSHRQKANGRVGVDLGVKHLAALSTGEVIDNPRHLDRSRRRMVRLQRELSRRQGPDKRTGRKASNRWRRTRAELSKLQQHIAEQRAAHLHQVTKDLCTRFAEVAIEDLNVAGMTSSAKGTAEAPGRGVRAKAGLNRQVLDAAPGEFRRQLEYKASWYGATIAYADRFAPTSKACSACGAVKTKLRLSERVYTCDGCGHTVDRDVNAAVNIAAVAVPVAPDRGDTENARGAPVSPTAPSGAAGAAHGSGKPRHAGAPGGSDPPAIPTRVGRSIP